MSTVGYLFMDSVILPVLIYKTWDEPEPDDESSKTWHTLSDPNGETYYLDFSPYAFYEPRHIEAFKACALLLGRMPETRDNQGINFQPNHIFTLLEKLKLLKDINQGDVY